MRLGDIRTAREQTPDKIDMSAAVGGIRQGITTLKENKKRESLRLSLQKFCERYLSHHFTKGFCELHQDLFDTIDDLKMGKRVARIAPRKFGKTTLISLALPLQKLAFEEKFYVLIVGETSTMSDSNLATLSQEIESNNRLLEDFPHLRPARDRKGQYVKWTDSQIVISNFATVVSKGMGARMRGMKYRQRRPDLAILDDPESPETADTFLKRRRHKRWFGGTFMGLAGDDWDIYVIGNLPHHDCLIASLMHDHLWDSKLWRAINIPDRNEERYPIGNTKKDGSALWPQSWSLKKLAEFKAEKNVGSLGFAREMMNDPREEEDKPFDPANFTYFDFSPEMLKFDYVSTTTVIDPSGGERPGEVKKGVRDWCAIVTAGRTRTGFVDIFDVVMVRCSPEQQITHLLNRYETWRARTVRVEDNQYKNLLAPSITRMARERRLYPTIITFHSSSNKIARILGMQPLIETQVVRFARHLIEKVPEYFSQFDEFPAGFDDGPDATETAVRALEAGRVIGNIISFTNNGSYWRS